jgi:MFS family permease
MIRVMVMDQWQVEFGLSETQKGEIFGAGMWPFGISIVLVSLVIDRIGYGKSMVFAFVCHVSSTIVLVSATGYWGLYVGSVLNALAAGTVEAVINPAVASMYPKHKTKMLTVLHAGWPGGLALAGIMLIAIGDSVPWQVKVGIILIPTLAYGAMLLRRRFPVSERVLAGVSYRDMLKEAGALGCLIVLYMVVMELNRVAGLKTYDLGAFFELPSIPFLTVLVVLTGVYFAYTRSLGRPMYIFLLLIMILLAITELGTDTWIKDLMTPAMSKLGLHPGLVLVYTATIMTVLRFCIGPIVKVLKPLGVLLVSSLFAAAGLYFLSGAQGFGILVMATVYGIGQCFFWPVTLGLVAERFPRGGALTLNAIAGTGMLGVGIVGAQLLGFWQDTSIDANLEDRPEAYQRLMEEEPQQSIFGDYRSLDVDVENEIINKTDLYEYRREVAAELGGSQDLEAALADDPEYQILVQRAFNQLVRGPEHPADMSYEEMRHALKEAEVFVDTERYRQLAAMRELIDSVRTDAKRNAMANVAVLPLIMAACYLGLILYFRAKGGYKAEQLA